jgi:hypothetical protein
MHTLQQQCPTCRRFYPPPLNVGGIKRQRIVDILSRRPEGMTAEALMNAVYGDEDGPDGGRRVICVAIYQARKILRRQGYDIKSLNQKYPAVYILRRLDGSSIFEPPGPVDAGRLGSRIEPAGQAIVADFGLQAGD